MSDDFIESLQWFQENKGDITRFAGFDEKRFREDYPEVWYLWVRWKQAERSFKNALNAAVEQKP